MRVLLVCMPFADLAGPAAGLSLLKARLLETGIECDVAYLNITFAQMLGVEEYGRVCNGLPPVALAGEWVFSAELRGDGAGPVADYTRNVLGHGWRPASASVEAAVRAHGLAGRFLDGAVTRLPWSDYDVVGFGSSGAQNVAALALARRVKERHARVKVVFGGHNWTGPMGIALHREFPFVDVAFLGHADQSLPCVVRALAGDDNAALDSVSGVVVRRANGRQRVVPGTPAGDLDTLPTPDHGDFYAAFSAAGLDACLEPRLPVETSRGCWWAAAAPCRFCGINGEDLGYRSKSAERTLAEAKELVSAWPGLRLELVDNVVPRAFLKTVLPTLTQWTSRPRLRFRIRPDTPVDDLGVVAGVRATVMCGLESLDDHLLTLRGQGPTCSTNSRLLRRCAELGISVEWNLLWGIPGETGSDYARQVGLVPELIDLDPPAAVLPLSLERWSRFWLRPHEFGFGRIRPAAAYRYVYPLSDRSLSDIAYFFDHEYSPPLSVRIQVDRLRHAVEGWARRDEARHIQR